MKNRLASALLLCLAACSPSSAGKPVQTEFVVEGMTCAGCEGSITQALQLLPGVSSATADHKSGKVAVTFDEARSRREEFAAAIRELGFSVR